MCVDFLYVKANSEGNCQERFREKMLMSAFLLRFKVNYLEIMRGYPHFSLWIPLALAKIYFFCVGPYLVQKNPLYPAGTVLKRL